MPIGLLGRKVGMTQIFDEAGAAIPVTVVEAGPCHVLQLRTDGPRRLRSGSVGLSRQTPPPRQPRQRGQVARLDSKRAKAQAKAGVEPLAKAGLRAEALCRASSAARSRASPSARC